MLNIKFEINQIFDYAKILDQLDDYHTKKYNDLLNDEELVKYFAKYDEENIEGQIEIWKRKTREYGVSRDYKFFLYAMMTFLDGFNLQYGLTFLYGQSLKLRHNEKLQNTLKAMSGKAHEIYSNQPILTKEEKIEELLEYNLCAFNTDKEKEKESPLSVCRKYPTCKDCLMAELRDELYRPLAKVPKKVKR